MLVKNELDDLYLVDASFSINFNNLDALNSNGIDEVEFYMSANKGVPERPLIKVASGGEVSRIMLGLKSVFTMLSMVDIIFFDEATSMLDPIGKSDVNNLIRDIQTDNPDLTIISITHDVEEVLDADHIIVISNGSIVFDGDLRGFFEFDLSNTTLEYPFMVTLLRKLKEAGYDMVLCD